MRSIRSILAGKQVCFMLIGAYFERYTTTLSLTAATQNTVYKKIKQYIP